METYPKPSVKVTNKGTQVKVNPVGLLNTAVRAGFKSYGTAIVEAIKAFEKEYPKETLAFELVYYAFINACQNLAKAANPEKWNNISNLGTHTKGLKVDASKDLEKLEVYITNDFFLRPNTLPFIHQFTPYFEAWLTETLALSLEESYNTARSLPNHFWQALDIEYRGKRKHYEALETYFKDTPFSKGLENNQNKRKYYNQIASFFHQPVLNDYRIKLSEIYLELGFEIHNRNWQEDKKVANQIEFSGENIHDYILNNFLKEKPKYGLKAESSRILLLLGQPGQGKSSFCYRLVHDLLPDWPPDRDLVFLRLRDLINPRDFLIRPFQEITIFFRSKGIEVSLDNALIVLDGLDELYMTEGLTNVEINQFFFFITRLVSSKPSTSLIISSRFHYVNLNKIGRDEALILSLNPLTIEQQKNWLKIYKKYHPKCKLDNALLERINGQNNVQFQSIRELINQPILLSLVAKADFEIQANDNKAKIYDSLFAALIEREKNKAGKFQDFDPEDFRDYIATIALYIYQSKNEYISSTELFELEETKIFIEDNVKGDFNKLEDALKEVLISFYFKEVDNTLKKEQKRNYAIEFLHKSLQEFMAGEKIWNTIINKFSATEGKKRPVIKNWKNALKIIWELVSDKPISPEVAQYLTEIIHNDDRKELKDYLAKRLIYFFPDLLDHYFIYQYDGINDTQNPMIKSTTCFYLCCHLITNLGGKLTSGGINLSKDRFTELLTINQIINPRKFNLENHDLSYAKLDFIKFENVNLRGAILDNAYLLGANLFDAKFNNATLSNTILTDSILINADFREAVLSKVDFSGANLLRANFKEAKLNNVDFSNAQLLEVNFKNAILCQSIFVGADLFCAILNGADLKGANLSNADLRETDLTGADLTTAGLKSVNLRGAKLEGAILRGVDMMGADLRGAELQKADLTGAELVETNLKGADLSYANLTRADLMGAFLNNANLEMAVLKDINLQDADIRSCRNLGIDQLNQVISLKNCIGLDPKIEEELKIRNPKLFE
ncbi:MAG: pentapeptide repeat-containing protein [Saprospiraceae bacterium]